MPQLPQGTLRQARHPPRPQRPRQRLPLRLHLHAGPRPDHPSDPPRRRRRRLDNFYLEKFREVAEETCEVVDTKFRGDSLAALEHELSQGSFGTHAIGVYDPIEDSAIVIRPRNNDPLNAFPNDPALAGKSPAWRQLDVAILQHLVFDRMIAPNFLAKNTPMSWAFPHEAHEVTTLCQSGNYRVGFLLQPTPLTAVRDLCNANELMPQKSTFFYPKLATGMIINPLT